MFTESAALKQSSYTLLRSIWAHAYMVVSQALGSLHLPWWQFGASYDDSSESRKVLSDAI